MLRLSVILASLASGCFAETRNVFLEASDGSRFQVATLEIGESNTYAVTMNQEAFSDHFLSMRPFKCLEGPRKNWCHVPYPYEIERDIGADMVDLEYDFLFVWKEATDYGINMWNGIYYKIEIIDGLLVGTLHEMDMDLLSAPPAAGNLRPLRAQDIHASDPVSHWLPRLIID